MTPLMQFILQWTAIAFGSLFAIWKIIEIFRDGIFRFDVDLYVIRSGRFVSEKDYAMQLGGKGDKKIRYFILGKMASTTNVEFDCIEKVGKRDKLTIIEQAPRQFVAVRKEFMAHLKDGTIDNVSVDEVFALLPRFSSEQHEALMDSADKVAEKGFLSDSDPDRINKTLVLVVVALCIFVAVVSLGALWVNYKYMTEGVKVAGEYHSRNIETFSRFTCRDEVAKILLEWQRNGTIPNWNGTIQAPISKPPDATDVFGRILNVK